MENRLALTNEQMECIDRVVSWFRGYLSHRDSGYARRFKITGFAGTGKTSIIPYIKSILYDKNLCKRVAFCCFTGKAVSTLKSRLDKFSCIQPGDFIGTIHSLMYIPIIETKNGRKTVIGWKKVENLRDSFDLIIVDEASMVSENTWNDLFSFGVPCLAVGDVGQLPPIITDTDSKISTFFNNPHGLGYNLKTILRQALENPIIRLSIMARETGNIPVGVYSNTVYKLPWEKSKDFYYNAVSKYSEDMIILCGINNRRINTNKEIRKLKQFDESYPYVGDRVICLVNNRPSGVFNGQLGTISWILPGLIADLFYEVVIKLDDYEDFYSCLMHKNCFNSLEPLKDMDYKKRKKINVKSLSQSLPVDFFDYGYSITTHKSQASEWDKVIIFEDDSSKYYFKDIYKQWLYTAVTRAKSTLFIIGN